MEDFVGDYIIYIEADYYLFQFLVYSKAGFSYIIFENGDFITILMISKTILI
jgi:hypothetical protein